MKKYIYLIIFFFLFPINVYGNEKIVIVDIDFLLKNSKQGLSIQKDFKSQNDKNLNNFKKKEKSLRDEEQKIMTKKNVLSEKDFEKEVLVFSETVKKYNSEKNKKINELNNKRNSQIVELLKEINLVLVEYSKNNNITTTLDKKYVIMTKSENDITKKILELLNKK